MTKQQTSPRLLLRHWLWLVLAVLALLHYLALASLGDPFNFGTLLSLCLAGIGATIVAFRYAARPLPGGPRVRHLLRVASLGLGTWYLSMTTWMVFEASSQEHEPVDLVLILGAGLKNGHPSHTLERRIQTAVAYLRNHPQSVAIACGGVGSGQLFSEAEVIRRQLIDGGVASEQVVVEDRSRSTLENLRFAHEFAKERVDRTRPRVLIITSNFHLARAKMLARHEGFEAFGLPAGTPWYILPSATARESLAIVKSVLMDLR